MVNEVARKLRRTMSRHEVKLWFRLRELRKQGFHFRRQGMAIYMGAGPSVMYASHALDALDAFEQFGEAAKSDDRAA